MSEQSWFIPGMPTPPHGPLARYRPVQPARAVGAYVRQFTQPGGLVVDLFCQGPTVVREAVAAGRRALGFSVNPLLLLATRLGLSQCDAAALNAAFTRLADSPKGDVPLRHHLASLYRSACPACGAPGDAVWFAWDRDGNYPFEKAVRCPQCEEVQEGTPDSDDLHAAQRIQTRGLAYYYALDRVAPPDHPARERAAQLVELYTPRNLSALMDLAMRLEGLGASENEIAMLALTGVLLDCFDACSSLTPPFSPPYRGGEGVVRSRPRTLRLPSRYLERNVWLCFEEGFSHFLSTFPLCAEELSRESHFPVQRTTDVAALVSSEAEGYTLVSHSARDVRKTVPSGHAALIFTDPSRPDGVFWALSALWAGWLWESAPAQAMRPFLRRRRFDWDWHCRVLQVALQSAGPLFTPEGHLITLFSAPQDVNDSLLASVCLATSGAGYGLDGWGYSPGVGHRLVWHWEPQEASPSRQDATTDVEMLERELMSVAEESVVSTLCKRGEPTDWALLHASVHARLVERKLLARTTAVLENGSSDKENPRAFTFTADAVNRALEAAPITQLTDQEGAASSLWWLADSSSTIEPPLADRVGTLVWELLARQPAWSLEKLVNAVCAHFSGPLTPDLALVLACINSYSVREDETIRLRPEDEPLRRAVERKTIRDDLVTLGKRMGFEVKQQGGWDARWLEEGQDAYVFDITTTVALGRHLLTRRAADGGAQRCLVVPGGRAGLVSFKLQRDPRLARAVAGDGWQFIKFRHLRRLLTEEELDRHALKTVLGLDPIVEQEAAQIPLF